MKVSCRHYSALRTGRRKLWHVTFTPSATANQQKTPSIASVSTITSLKSSLMYGEDSHTKIMDCFREYGQRPHSRKQSMVFVWEDARWPQDATVRAIVSSLSTAELLLTIKEDFDTTEKEVTDTICTIKDSTIHGCYHCAQGAVATILCYSEKEYTMASITCDDATFTVPCHPTGAISSLRFSFTRAQIRQQCVTTCGTTKTKFELTGILYWTRTLRTTAERVIAGQSTVYDEFVLPDLGHILDVFISWYKFGITVVVIALLSIAIGYVFLWSFGLRIVLHIIVLLWKTIYRSIRYCVEGVLRVLFRRRRRTRTRKDL
ncbi:hypothetical protein COOONC_26694 [Cooperia oncophora]